MDYIHLNEMEFYGYHGALHEETSIGSAFSCDSITCSRILAEAGKTDDLEKTVNYAEVYRVCAVRLSKASL